MKSVLVFTPHSHPSHYERDIPLVKALRRRGHRATYAVPAEGFNERIYSQTNYPNAILDRPAFLQIGTLRIRSYAEFRAQVKQHDVLMMGLTKEKTLADIARIENKFLIQHMDMGGMDLINFEPDLLALPGPWYREKGAKWHRMPLDRVIVTGSVQYDRAQSTEVLIDTREKFCARYGLDPAKPIIVWLPEGPGTHSPWYQEKYKAICSTIQKVGKFNLIVKGHPWDYAGYAREKYYRDLSRPSWEQLTPGVVACNQEDAYPCFRHCDLGITVTSSVFLDFPLFKKPILFVDFQEGVLPLALAESAQLPVKRFQGAGLRRLRILPDTKELLDTQTCQRTAYADVDLAGGVGLPYVGGECSLAELYEVLDQELFRVQDDSNYQFMVETFCYRNDGQAAERIAALVDRLGQKPIPPKSSSLWRKAFKKIFHSSRKVTAGAH